MKTETVALAEAEDLLLATSEDEATIELYRLSTGEYLQRWVGSPQEGPEPEPGRFGDDVEGIAVDPERGLLFSSDEANGRIMIHALDTALSSEAQAQGVESRDDQC